MKFVADSSKNPSILLLRKTNTYQRTTSTLFVIPPDTSVCISCDESVMGDEALFIYASNPADYQLTQAFVLRHLNKQAMPNVLGTSCNYSILPDNDIIFAK